MKNKSSFWLVFWAAFVFGIMLGLLVGIILGEHLLFKGAATVLKDSNVNLTIALNETTLVNEFNRTVTPYFVEAIKEGAGK